MAASSDGTRDNLTLSEADLAACRPIVGEGGHVVRAFCPLPRLRPPAELARAGAQRPLCLLCLWRLGLHGRPGRSGVRGAARQAAYRRPPAPSSAHRTVASRHRRFPGRQCCRQAALRRSPSTACVSPQRARPCPPARGVPGRPAGEPWRHLPAAAGHFPWPWHSSTAWAMRRRAPGRMQPATGAAAAWSFPIPPRTAPGEPLWPCCRSLQSRCPKPSGTIIFLVRRAINATALQAGHGPLWVCEGRLMRWRCLLQASRVRGHLSAYRAGAEAWAREVRELVFALDADVAGQQQWRQLARQRHCGGSTWRRSRGRLWGGARTSARPGRRGCWRWTWGLQQCREGQPTRCLRTSVSPGRSASRSWSSTVASARGRRAPGVEGSRPQAPRREGEPPRWDLRSGFRLRGGGADGQLA